MNLYQLRNKNWGNAPSRLQLFSAVKTCNKIRPEKSLFKLVQCNWSDYNMIWCDWFVTSRMLFFNSKIKIKQNKSKCIIKILFTNSKAFFYQLYKDWQNQQVLTTISTTGFIEKNCLSFPRYWLKWAFLFCFFWHIWLFKQYLVQFIWINYFSKTAYSVMNVDFPSVTFCSPGINEVITNATLIKMFYDFLQNKFNITTDHSPFEIANLLNKVKFVFHYSTS